MNGNDLHGTVPQAWGRLTNLTQLALNGNQLYGELPRALALAGYPNGRVKLNLDDTFCYTGAFAQSDELFDYLPSQGPVDAHVVLPATCPTRPCPENFYSATGNDTDGSSGGCSPCPAGLFVFDRGGVSPSSGGAGAHAGAGACAPPPPSPPPAPPAPPSPPPPPFVASSFACTVQDATCAALGELYAASGGATSWAGSAGWGAAAGGNVTDCACRRAIRIVAAMRSGRARIS